MKKPQQGKATTNNRQLDSLFIHYAKQFFGDIKPAFNWQWMKALGIAESNLNPLAVSEDGAQGIMQLMPSTSQELARKLGCSHNPFNPELNIQMGIVYARSCYDIWQDEQGIERIRFMLGAYNAGRRHIIKAQLSALNKGLCTSKWEDVAHCLPSITGQSAQETIAYVAKVERIYNELTSQN